MADYCVWVSWLSFTLVILVSLWIFLHIIHVNKGFMSSSKWLNGGDYDYDDY